MTSQRRSGFAAHLTAYGTTFVFLIPVYILINLAIRPPGDTTPGIIPSSRATFGNFTQAWTQSSLPSAILTSVIITTVSCVLILTLATMAAYPLARSTARLSTATFYFFLIGLLLPFQLALLPLYLQMRDLGLLGTIWSVILVHIGLQMPFSIFLITTFLRTGVPGEYEEAARIDGCGNVGTFWRIVVPLLRPVLGTALILNGVAIWNEFFIPLLYLAGGNRQTIPLAVYAFVGQYSTNWPLLFAALIIAMVPILTLYLVFQRYIIMGFAGGLKG